MDTRARCGGYAGVSVLSHPSPTALNLYLRVCGRKIRNIVFMRAQNTDRHFGNGSPYRTWRSRGTLC